MICFSWTHVKNCCEKLTLCGLHTGAIYLLSIVRNQLPYHCYKRWHLPTSSTNSHLTKS
jgi:hypothetical protein